MPMYIINFFEIFEIHFQDTTTERMDCSNAMNQATLNENIFVTEHAATAQFVLAPGTMEHVEGTMIQNDLVFVAADIKSEVALDESAAAESKHEATEASTMGATSELCSALGENSSSELYESMVILSNMHKYMFSR